MRAVDVASVRMLDRLTMESIGGDGGVLMDRAGLGLARELRRMLGLRGTAGASVVWLAGRGNNGGDVFAGARWLAPHVASQVVLLAGDVSDVKGDAATHYERLPASVKVVALPTRRDWEQYGRAWCGAPDLVVDGLLGTGVKGAARGQVAAAIEFVNELGRTVPVVAIDIPSGMNGDSGEVAGPAVRADMTVTMGVPKAGMLNPQAKLMTGSVRVLDIGYGAARMAAQESRGEVITAYDVREWLGRRDVASHKGRFGHVLVVGGARGFAGAVGMAAAAAGRVGSGLVSVLTASSVADRVAVMCPEAMVHGGVETARGTLGARAYDDLMERGAVDYDAVVLGPGLTQEVEGAALIERVLKTTSSAVVLDADALNLVASGQVGGPGGRAGVVMTPHPGEAGRLLGRSVADVEQDRVRSCGELALRYGATVVLKGAASLVADETRMMINLSGNAGMATGGMGDVLAGMIGGLLAQGMACLPATAAAVHWHGRAGDDEAMRRSQAGVLAMDLLSRLPVVQRDMCGR